MTTKSEKLADLGNVTGQVITLPAATIPNGWLECDGASLDTTVYADLFAVLGYIYGGSGANFNIPDYRGEFLRGHANTSTNDPDRATRTDRGDGTTGDVVGSKQPGGIEEHDHSLQGSINGIGSKSDGAPYANLGTGNLGPRDTEGVSGPISASGDTRPRNVNVIYCIKY